MKTAIFILIFILNSIHGFSQSIEYHAKLFDGQYLYYVNKSNKGPLYINDDVFCFIDENNDLVILDIIGNELNRIKLYDYKSKIYKIGDNILVISNNTRMIFDGENFLEYEEHIIYLRKNIYYDLDKGLYIKKEDNHTIDLIDSELDRFINITGIPQVSQDGSYVFFIVKDYVLRDNNLYGTLYKYSIKGNKLEKVKDKVGNYCFLPKNRMLLYEYNSKYSIMNHNLFPGDFTIINTTDNEELYNSDDISYMDNSEFIINEFDSNSKGYIVAFGVYGIVKNGNLIKSFKPILKLKYID